MHVYQSAEKRTEWRYKDGDSVFGWYMVLEKPGSVILYASQLASAIGYNKHKRPCECLENMWERTRPESYREALIRNSCFTEAERLDRIVKEHSVLSSVLETSLQECESSEDVARTYDEVSRKIREIGSSLAISADDQAVVDTVVKRNLYTTYGTSSESEALQRMDS